MHVCVDAHSMHVCLWSLVGISYLHVGPRFKLRLSGPALLTPLAILLVPALSFYYITLADLELRDLTTSASSTGIQGMYHQLTLAFLYNSGPQAQAGHYSSELGPPQENVPQV